MRQLLILLVAAAFIVGAVVMQVRIIKDCGWAGMLKGSEMVWLFGGCEGRQ